MMSLYELRDVAQVYEKRMVLEIPALDIAAGAILGLRGHNGSGKSTLLRMLAFVERPARGTLRFDGEDVTHGASLAKRRQACMLGQEPFLLTRSVRGNVAYGLEMRGEHGVTDKVDEALELVGLPPTSFAHRSWSALSGGEKQRVALAARLALHPKALLLDEPTASLDAKSAVLIKSAAFAARERYGAAVVVSSHDSAWLDSVSDAMVELYEGRLVASR